jgi:hypothetical protein
MEIRELVSYYLYEDTKRIEVTFRLSLDSEDEVRNDIINLEEAEEFGYNLIEDNNDFFQFDDEEDDDEDFDDFVDIDEDLLISFLNEYYIINPNKLPKTEIL